MKVRFSISLLLFVCTFGFSQVAQFQDSLSSVSQLEFMIGTWQGEGWIMGQDRSRKRFSQTETIVPKVHHQALMIDGLGYAIDSTGLTDRVIHDAFGIISLDPDSKRITMISFSEMSGRMETEMKLVGEKHLQWSFPEPRSGGTVRFTEDFSEAGKWIEKGEISMDGSNWFPFFEMRLERQ